jgi:dsRNA-specific ribonuclease
VLTNAKLASVGKEQHLEDCVQLGNGQSMPLSTNMMATTVQALVGAVYLDGVGGGEGGIEAVRAVMRSLGLVDVS